MASGEDDLIAQYFRPLADTPASLGLLDDAAVLAGSADDLVITTDAIVEGVHYLASDPPETIARKALRVNLSDLAAKGSAPAGFLLTLALRKVDEELARRVRERARRRCLDIRLSAARRRHRLDLGAGDDLDHRVRPRAEGRRW